MNLTPIVKNLLIINVLFFVATWIFKQQGIDLYDILGAHYFNSPKFRVWQLITHMFMHADIGHIFFNMFGLYIFGGLLESHYGAKRFINFYLICGLGALLCQWAVQAIELYQLTGAIIDHGKLQLDNLAQGQYNPQVFSENQASHLMSIYFGTMVGASGAIFGVMTAIALIYPNLEMLIMFIPFPVKIKYLVPFYIVIELYSAFNRQPEDFVAHFAHLGGALVGFLLVKFWRRKGNYYDYYE